MALFNEEFKVLSALLSEWYEEMHHVTADADGIFSEKGKMYDRESPVWQRVKWPDGFQHEIGKKADRVKQLLTMDNGNIRWSEVEEELIDILNYSRMFVAITRMMLRRRDQERAVDESIRAADQAKTERMMVLPTGTTEEAVETARRAWAAGQLEATYPVMGPCAKGDRRGLKPGEAVHTGQQELRNP